MASPSARQRLASTMNRRRFLGASLFAAALAPLARAEAEAVERAAGGSRSAPGRPPRRELLIMGGQFDLSCRPRTPAGAVHLRHPPLGQGRPGAAPAPRSGRMVLCAQRRVHHADRRHARAHRPRRLGVRAARVPHAFAMVSEGEGQMLVLSHPPARWRFLSRMAKFGKEIRRTKKPS